LKTQEWVESSDVKAEVGSSGNFYVSWKVERTIWRDVKRPNPFHITTGHVALAALGLFSGIGCFKTSRDPLCALAAFCFAALAFIWAKHPATHLVKKNVHETEVKHRIISYIEVNCGNVEEIFDGVCTPEVGRAVLSIRAAWDRGSKNLPKACTEIKVKALPVRLIGLGNGRCLCISNTEMARGATKIFYRAVLIGSKYVPGVVYSSTPGEVELNADRYTFHNRLDCKELAPPPKMKLTGPDFDAYFTKFADGERRDLFEWISEHRSKAPSKAVEEKLVSSLYEIARGLNELHKQGFVHLNLSPTKLMLFEKRARLGGFGQMMVEQGRKIRPEVFAGSPEFLDPGPSRVSWIRDMFAFGRIIEIAMGELSQHLSEEITEKLQLMVARLTFTSGRYNNVCAKRPSAATVCKELGSLSAILKQRGLVTLGV